MKKLLTAICFIMCAVLCVCGCTSDKNTAGGKLSVVVTAFPHYDFVRQIAGDNAQITMLVKPGTEVHNYEPTPTDIAKISTCDVFVYTGGESDIWAKGILESVDNENMRVISFTDICLPVAAGEDVHGEDGISHAHITYDEHVWTSPINAKKISEEIFNVLCEADEKNANKYMKSFDAFIAELDELDGLFRNAVSSGKRNMIVVGDRFPFTHLAKEYGFEYVSAFPGCSSETEPSAKKVAELSAFVKENEIPVVFTIEFSNKKIAKNIVADSDAEILMLHSCHNVTEDGFLSKITYVELMTQNAENLRKALN